MSVEPASPMEVEGQQRTMATQPSMPDTPITVSKTGSLDMVELGSESLSKEAETPDISPAISPALAQKYRLKAHIQFFAACWSLFLAGWNDGTTGPLLPRIREVYHARYTAPHSVDYD